MVKLIQYTVSAISFVLGIGLGGVFALMGVFQLLGGVDNEGMLVNLIFGFGIIAIGCVVIPYFVLNLNFISNKDNKLKKEDDLNDEVNDDDEEEIEKNGGRTDMFG